MTNDRGMVMPVNAMPMNKKTAVMKQIIEGSQKFYEQSKTPEPYSLSLRVKHFYPKQQIQPLLERIKKNESDEEYYYRYKDAYNKNDGLIFTPATSDLYTFIPGTSLNLVKWKWSEKLTVDFYLEPFYQNSTLQFNMYYGIVSYPSKQKINVYYGTASYELMATHTSKDELSKLNEQMQTKRPIIAECFLDVSLNCWVIELIRVDKVYPNEYLTAFSTITTAVENITKKELIGMFGERVKPNFDYVPSLDDAFIAQAIENQFTLGCRVKFNAFKRNTSFALSYEVYHVKDQKGAEQWTRVVGNHDEIIGPSGETDQQLVDYFIDQVCRIPIKTGHYTFNVGFVQMVFIPRIGKFKVIQIFEETIDAIQVCSAVHAFRVLESMHKKKEVSKRKRQTNEDDAQEKSLKRQK
eukprot:CAMPEP_0117418460 /NCGR_PEP_ID=MMETSP0758-20121206/233_1 /TAXON_ID=63605 /ORGANISM="Percolomonas cosmopolitus, Strain AE-1 (ATCC 50343)" /LENGTH=408 /DNA_ID=CAMNT_0005198969 /DNA_START=122 /DNA_END=1345 /DNA_ORIENTATION=-